MRIMHMLPALALTLAASAPAAAQTAQPAPTGPQDRDPALITGTLPNGLRYYIRENAMPAERAHLWLAINAGSVLEDDDQQGFAHFLEHMAFNGTRRFPQHEIIDFVESSGMKFGADLNAYTSFDETVYQLTVPTDDPAFLARGLDVLEDWAAGGIVIDSVEVVKERGVVMGEWRSRALLDTATQRLNDHIQDFLYDTTVYRRRFPIGKPALLDSATVAPLRRFYEDWYRPDLMAVIAVGDFDARAVERVIRERFGAIPAAENARTRFRTVAPFSDTPQVDIMRDKVSPRVDVLWRAPEPAADARSALRDELVWSLLRQHVDRKLLRIREASSRPFIQAALSRGRMIRPMNVVGAELITWPDSLQSGLARLLTEIERVAQHGIADDVLQHGKAALLRRLEGEADGAAGRPSRAFAEDYTQHYLAADGDLLSPDQRLALARELMPQITSATLAEAAKFWHRRDGLKVLVRFPTFALGFAPPTRESVLAIFDSVAAAAIPADAAQRSVAAGPLMTEPPAPGSIVEEHVHGAAGVIEWRLSNGARVLVRSGYDHPDEILVRAWSPGGFSRMSDALFFSSGRMVGPIMTEAAGAGERDHEDVLAQLSTTSVRPLRVDIGYADESMELGGSPRELETMFQLLHLQFTAPKLDSAALETWSNVAKFQRRGATIHDQLNQTFARGNPRLLPVSTGLAQLARPEEALAVFRDRFGNAGDFTFLIVGAAAAEDVRPLVERYIATLPATDTRETPADPRVRPFVGATTNRQRILPVARAQMLLVFDDTFPTAAKEYFSERQKLAALTLVLERRLRARLREELGGTYGVAVQAQTYRLYDEHFRVLISFQAAPDRMYDLDRELRDILEDVRTSGATPEELSTIARIQQRQLETALQDNTFWLGRLELYDRLDLPFDRIVSPWAGTPLGADDIRAAAQRYLPAKSFIHIIQLPQDDAQ